MESETSIVASLRGSINCCTENRNLRKFLFQDGVCLCWSLKLTISPFDHVCFLGAWLNSSLRSSQAVRISDDRFRHPECYTCTDCGLNLSMRGHFWIGDVMYCEKHAKERYQGPGSSPQATVSPHHWVCHSTPASLWTQRAACLA